MIRSELYVLQLMEKGWRLCKSAFSGWVLRFPDKNPRKFPSKKSVWYKTVNKVKRMEQIVRTDDGKTKCGETWEHISEVNNEV